jgi:hypothetical protein
MPRIDNAIVAMMDRIVNCGDLVDLAEAEVAAALNLPRSEALRALGGLRAAERQWCGARRIPQGHRHMMTPFSGARFDLEQLLGVRRRKGRRKAGLIRLASSPPLAPL